jgi:hypothetical protein
MLISGLFGLLCSARCFAREVDHFQSSVNANSQMDLNQIWCASLLSVEELLEQGGNEGEERTADGDQKRFAMVKDLLEYPWLVRPPVVFASTEELVSLVSSKIITPAEEKHQARQQLLNELFSS